MGFWDILDKVVGYIPVVGTIKDGVEAVVLEVQGKHAAAKEKALEAVIDLAGDAVTVATLGAGYEVAAAGKAAAEVAMKELVESGAKGVGKDVMLKATKAGFSRKAAATIAVAAHAAEEKERLKQQIHGRKKVRGPKTRPPSWPTDETEEKKSKKGEHVINNGVRRALPKIIDKFLIDNHRYFRNMDFKELCDMQCVTGDMNVFVKYEQPLPGPIALRIEEMIAFVPEGEQYFDQNAVVYGMAIGTLSVLIANYMSHLFKVLVEDERERSRLDQHYRDRAAAIDERINEMNTPGAELYVDRQALGWWLATRGNRMADYREARNYVAEMFTSLSPLKRATGNVVTWVRELFQAYQRLNDM